MWRSAACKAARGRQAQARRNNATDETHQASGNRRRRNQGHRRFRTGTARWRAMDGDGMFVVPVNYGYRWHKKQDGAESLSLYLHSAREGRKAEAFFAGGKGGVRVAIELEEDRGNITGTFACAYSRSYRSIMGSGIVFAVDDPSEKEQALRLIMAHAAPICPPLSSCPMRSRASRSFASMSTRSRPRSAHPSNR